jgi:hypothetical protein
LEREYWEHGNDVFTKARWDCVGSDLCAAAGTGLDSRTFDYTELGWFDFDAQTGTVGASRPDLEVTGVFSGAVEAGGLIELGDLSSFSAVFSVFGIAVIPVGSESLADLTLFSFITTGGPSTLDFAGSAANLTNICMGAAVALDAQCTSDFTVFYPPGTFSVDEAGGTPTFIAMSQPQITLVSSVATPSASTPEPATIFPTGAVLLGTGILRRRARVKKLRLNPTCESGGLNLEALKHSSLA